MSNLPASFIRRIAMVYRQLLTPNRFSLCWSGKIVNHLLWIFTLCALSLSVSADITRSHAIAMHGQPLYPANFSHFSYTSLQARKGGELRLHAIGTYDSLNPYIAKGNAADELGLLYDTLMVGSADEPFTEYGLLAKYIEYPEDRSWVIFELNPLAHFHDGVPVSAEDVVFTFHLLMEKGAPNFTFYYGDVDQVEALDSQRIKFTFKANASKEMPLIAGQLPVLPKHYWENRDFEQSSQEIPLGSGPYRIKSFDSGRSITYERVADYWAINLPPRVGMFNFDRIRIDYYRDYTVAMEALKAGEYDVRIENVSKLWATAYTGNAIDDGRLKKVEIHHENPAGMQAFIFNIRNPLFQDHALREAIALAFDFEWTNKNLFYDAYIRTQSFFANSELASSGLPDEDELKLLRPFQKELPESVFNQAFTTPKSAGDFNNRANLRQAKALLDKRGYKVVDNQLFTPDGKPIIFEIMLYDTGFERVTNPFIRALTKLGITASIRLVDTSQYINRIRDFQYDMIVFSISQSLSPGAEQINFWHSSTANVSGSRNLIGIQNPVIDALVENVVNAKTRESLVTATHALDRVLLHQHYVIPQWHINYHRIAYWDKFLRPEIAPRYDPGYQTGLMTWWAKPEHNTSTQSAAERTRP